jgi:hypothetical protein
MTATGTRSDGPTAGPTDRQESAQRQAEEVASTVATAGREAASALSEQTAAVADTAKQQFDSFVGQARSEAGRQVEAQGQHVIRGLHTLTDELSALANGRPDQAGQVAKLVGDAQQRLQQYVSSLDARGPQGALDDVTRFARRRPAMFLLGAGVAGFAIGRLVRAGASADANGNGNGNGAAAMQASPDWTRQPDLERSGAPAYATGQQGSWQTSR